MEYPIILQTGTRGCRTEYQSIPGGEGREPDAFWATYFSCIAVGNMLHVAVHAGAVSTYEATRQTFLIPHSLPACSHAASAGTRSRHGVVTPEGSMRCTCRASKISTCPGSRTFRIEPRRRGERRRTSTHTRLGRHDPRFASTRVNAVG